MFCEPLPYGEGLFVISIETVARCAPLGRSQDVCNESRLYVKRERCVVSS